MTCGCKDRRQEREIGAPCVRAAKLRRRMARRADDEAGRGRDRAEPARGQVNAVRADGSGEAEIAGDEKQQSAGAAYRAIAARRAGAPWVVIVAIDDGGAFGEGAQNRFGVRDAAPVGQESERKWRS